MQEAGRVEEAGQRKNKKKTVRIPTVEAVVEREADLNEASAPAVNDSSVSEQAAPAAEDTPSAAAHDAGEPAHAPSDADEPYEDDEELSLRRASMNLDSETALLEAVLFLESEPQSVEGLERITQFSHDVVTECLDRLKDKYSAPDSGIELAQIIGGWLLTPKKECFDLVRERYGKKNEGRLSKAAIETLSIIAYSQPITRAEIESIRHVNADNMMRILLERKFIKEVGKKDIPGKPVLYGTTREFLEFFHLQSIADLPQLDEKENERFIELAR